MIDFKVGDTLIGKINNCKIKVLEIKTDATNTEMVRYQDLNNNTVSYAPLKRLQHSNFEIISS